MEKMLTLLAIESSCDETAVAVVRREENGTLRALSNEVNSQIPLHARYGGVVPEIASRAHAEAISALCTKALQTAGVQPDGVCVTSHPGLIGALLVGVNFAKGYAFANDLPLCEVDHIKGHIAASYFLPEPPRPPFLALVASGGHTSLIYVRDYTRFETVGSTRDDAIGEGFDKVARVMGIPYPGGAEMDRLAHAGNADAYAFPSAAIHDDSLDFSFSGLKTAVINQLHRCEQKGEPYQKEDVAASFTRVVCESVCKKTLAALRRYGLSGFVLCGGVAANSHLRQALGALCAQENVRFFVPERALCGDNAAMIGAQGIYEFSAGKRAGTDLNASASDAI